MRPVVVFLAVLLAATADGVVAGHSTSNSVDVGSHWGGRGTGHQTGAVTNHTTTSTPGGGGAGGAGRRNVSYHGHQVLEIYPNSRSKIDQFLHFGREQKLDFWKLPSHVNDSLHVQVGPGQLKAVKVKLEKMKTSFGVFIHDVEKLIDEQFSDLHRRRGKRSASGFDLYSYQSSGQIYRFLESVCSESKATCHLMNIGRSSEGRDIKMLKLASSKRRSQQKPGILIDAGMHGREWIAISVILHFIYELAINPTNNRENKNMLNNFDWFFVPVLNPDGYEYSRSHDRLWRKTRSRSSNQYNCIGVDINRNFPNHWNEGGSSNDPCSVEFAGVMALSEPETMALANLMRINEGTMLGYISLHSYGQLWMYPWGFTFDPPDDINDLFRIATKATNAIRQYSSIRYQVGPSSQILYIASGASDDYAKANRRIKYAYTVELRDVGRYGFLLPKRLIAKTCEETFAGLKAFAQALSKKSRRHRKRRAKRQQRSRRG